MMRVTADTFAVQTMVLNGLLPILQALILLCGTIFILAPINLTLTVISLSIVPVLAVLIGLFNRRIVRAATAARDADARGHQTCAVIPRPMISLTSIRKIPISAASLLTRFTGERRVTSRVT
jgi:ATP-binding cassette subfamily B protein/subfamily B ATP-binding cassette protein MsbA